RQRIETAARWTARWLERGEASPSDAALVQEALAALELPPGDGFIWIAGEAALVKTLRAHFVERGHPRAWIHAAAYWKFGHADVHEVVEDC
ncbi:MAG TPA: SIP domain-containing protein, partial [Polyangiaceae bacterium]|nr:SIP domain-containing protein [Polyangiaceae bacterium]